MDLEEYIRQGEPEQSEKSTAVFIIKYLKTFGFSVNNEIFAKNSWYFRNSLVRVNDNDLTKGINPTTIKRRTVEMPKNMIF